MIFIHDHTAKFFNELYFIYLKAGVLKIFYHTSIFPTLLNSATMRTVRDKAA